MKGMSVNISESPFSLPRTTNRPYTYLCLFPYCFVGWGEQDLCQCPLKAYQSLLFSDIALSRPPCDPTPSHHLPYGWHLHPHRGTMGMYWVGAGMSANLAQNGIDVSTNCDVLLSRCCNLRVVRTFLTLGTNTGRSTRSSDNLFRQSGTQKAKISSVLLPRGGCGPKT